MTHASESRPIRAIAATRGAALLLLPADLIGGAERILVSVAEEMIRQAAFSSITIYVLCRANTGTLAHLKSTPETEVKVVYSCEGRELRGARKFVGFVFGKRFDFVFSTHTHTNGLCSILRKMGLLRTRRMVLRESTMVFDYAFTGKHFSFLIPLFPHLYGAQDLLVCQTSAMAMRFNAGTRDRQKATIKVIPNPVGGSRFSEADEVAEFVVPSGRKTIVWCGRFITSKMPALAVDTLKCLVDMGHDDLQLVLIGDGPLRASLEQHIEALGLGGRVFITGHVHNPVNIMRQCHLGLLTSTVEGFPNVILEMLASGVKRVVTTACAGDLDLVPGVHVAKEMTAVALAGLLNSVKEMAADEKLRDFLDDRSISRFLQKILGDT